VRQVDVVVIAFGSVALALVGFVFASGRGAALEGAFVAAAVLWLLAIAAMLWAGRKNAKANRVAVIGIRALAYAVAGVLLVAAASRLKSIARGDNHWPPKTRGFDEAMSRLSERERATWAIRVLAHALTSGREPLSRGQLPPDWPFPAVRFALETRSDTTVVRTRVEGEDWTCMAAIHDGALLSQARADSPIRCGADVGNAEAFRTIVQTSSSDSLHDQKASPKPSTANWAQYRGNGAKAATRGATAVVPGGWRTRVGGEIRSSIALVGDAAVIGTHGTGVLASLDVATGRVNWRRTLPNWIHEDAVSDGTIVVAGFGDNIGSFFSRAPAGVAAYRLADGLLMWTAFESNSVMSSPVLAAGRVIYATAAGVLRARDLVTGRLLGETRLPGAVQMAPPALAGDTVIVATDPNRLCALSAQTLATYWCRVLPGVVSASGSAPSVAAGIVIQSAPIPMSVYRVPAQLSAMGADLYVRSAIDVARGQSYRPAGQRLFGLDARSGDIIWQSRDFPATRFIRGHSSGTPVMTSAIGVVLLPIADIVLAFDVTTGRELWRAAGEQSRGPALVIDNTVYVFGGSGVIRTMNLSTGAVTCRHRSRYRFDRAGPAAAGALLTIGTTTGDVVGVPRTWLDECRTDQLREMFG
jgi:outer membrane protein assembly factor BamB